MNLVQSETDTSDNNITPYRVLARKYRPSTFEELLGQAPMVQTLTNSFKAGRIAQAYMLTGVRGIGKTTTARLIARALNYKLPDSDDGPTTRMDQIGVHCQAIMESTHVDVIEIDAASNTSVQNIREIIDSAHYKPVSARYKVYIIDEVHMLSKSAFNALLKTLEEPPEHIKFILATTEIRKVPVTVLSRCQRFDLRRLDVSLLSEHFSNIAKKENINIDADALAMISRAAEGSVRDGLSLLDQAIAFGGSEVTGDEVKSMLGLVDRSRVIQLFEMVMRGDAAGAITEVEAQYTSGADPQTILADFAGFVHWVTKVRVMPEALDDAAYSEAERNAAKEQAQKLSMPVLSRAWQMSLKGLDEVKMAANALMAVEMVFIRLAYAAELPTPDKLIKQLQDNPPAPSNGNVTQMSRPAPAGNRVSMPPRGQTQMAAPQPASDQPGPADNSADFTSMRDVVALAGKMRDIKLKTSLERMVRPIRVSRGKIEFALEPRAPQGLAGELSRKLEAWTGERWMVMVARDGGDDPLSVQDRNEKDNLFRQMQQDPLVGKVLSMFPDAQITNVVETAPVEMDPFIDE